ncbi:hypothetical protein N0Y54_32820, partial [Nostoc punctiforme UO1]
YTLMLLMFRHGLRVGEAVGAKCGLRWDALMWAERQIFITREKGSDSGVHPWWDDGKGWKNILNNLRLIIQPFTLFNLIFPWLTVFPIPQLSLGFSKLQSIIYNLTSSIFISLTHPDFYFSSA